jgi:hypothetical protein
MARAGCVHWGGSNLISKRRKNWRIIPSDSQGKLQKKRNTIYGRDFDCKDIRGIFHGYKSYTSFFVLHADCLPSLHRLCGCGADGVKSGGKYRQYRQSSPHMYDMIDSIPPYIRYRQIVRAQDFSFNQLVQGSSPWRITNRIFQSLPDWQALYI